MLVAATVLTPSTQPCSSQLNFSARTADGRFNLDALPASAEGDYCAVMLLKETDPLAKEGADPEEMRADFDRILPQFSRLIDDDVMKRVAAKPVSRLPSFRYLKRLNKGRVVVLGDAAHSVKVRVCEERSERSGATSREGAFVASLLPTPPNANSNSLTLDSALIRPWRTSWPWAGT